MPVLPGSEHPLDVADTRTPVAHDADDVRRLAAQSPTVRHVTARVSVCRACPRLVAWREEVSDAKRAAFRGEIYWGRPLSGFGAERPRVLIVGLAPAAHGGNRTGRIFTGDRSGDWLFGSLHRVGLANQPQSVDAGDGLELFDTRVLAAVRCAPPANRPSPEERDTCQPWMEREVELVKGRLRSVVALGGFAWESAWRVLAAVGYDVPPRRKRFTHGVEVEIDDLLLIGSYHPSQQNTFTGKLTEPMIDAVMERAAAHAGVQRP